MTGTASTDAAVPAPRTTSSWAASGESAGWLLSRLGAGPPAQRCGAWHGLASLDEQAVAALRFDRVLLLRSAQKPADSTGRSAPARLAHTLPRTLHDALRLGLPVTGCTVHRATPAVDDGPILGRAEVPVLTKKRRLPPLLDLADEPTPLPLPHPPVAPEKVPSPVPLTVFAPLE